MNYESFFLSTILFPLNLPRSLLGSVCRAYIQNIPNGEA